MYGLLHSNLLVIPSPPRSALTSRVASAPAGHRPVELPCVSHVPRHYIVTQSTVTLSTAESELNGICMGTSVSLGLITISEDLGLTLDLIVETNVSATIGVSRRRGLCRIGHLAVADLWIQDRVRSGDLILRKVAGSDNASDIRIKSVDRPLLRKHLSLMGLYAED